MIGGKIKALRKSLGLSQADFSNKIGIRQGHLSEIERDISTPSANIVLSLIRLFPDLNVEFLIGEGEMYVKKECAKGDETAEGEKKGNNQHNAEGDRVQNDTTPVQHPQNTRLTPAQQPLNANAKTHAIPAQTPPYSPATPAQQALNANASSIAIKTHPFLYEAIGYRLAVHELDIIEGDILVIDPTLTAESGDIILRSSPEGPELAKYQPGEKNTKGILVGLTRQYPAINRQPDQQPPAGQPIQ